eukprot:15440084-Alexandrium_andersonii.AAC.1
MVLRRLVEWPVCSSSSRALAVARPARPHRAWCLRPRRTQSAAVARSVHSARPWLRTSSSLSP